MTLAALISPWFPSLGTRPPTGAIMYFSSLTRTLRHPSVCPIGDAGETSGRFRHLPSPSSPETGLLFSFFLPSMRDVFVGKTRATQP